MLGFALCFVCLAATTWAWFTASVTSEANTIQTANFDVNVAVTDGTTPVNAVGGVYPLSANKVYTVTLTPTGNATKGFAVVEVAAAQPPSNQMLMLASAGNEEQQAISLDKITTAGTYCTQQLFDENGVAQVATFTIQATGDVTLTVKAYWGEKQTDLVATPITATLTPLSNEAQLTNEEETPVDETQQEEEQENQQEEEKEKTPSDENNPADDPENNGEGENTSTDTPAEGEGEQPSDPANGENGQQGGEQQGDEPSTPTDGEGEQPDVSGETTGGDIGDDTITGGETPTDTTTPAGGDVPTEPVVTTDPAAQSEGGAPANPAPIE